MTDEMSISVLARADDPARAELARRVSISCDALFVLATLATAWWWFWRLSRRFFFQYDDWSVATRPGALSDLLKPHNKHLSVVPLLVYRGVLSVFGLQSYAPYRLVGILGILSLTTGLYLLARTRLGAVPALVIGMCALWLPSTSLTPFLFNFTVPLALAVLCCWELPSKSFRADVVIFAALVFALCTSAVGVAVAGACIAHTALRPSRTRALAVILPLAGWLLWYSKYGVHDDRPGSIWHALRLVAGGIFGSFEDIVFGSAILVVLVCTACAVLLAWRIRNDSASARLQFAWLVALLVWWSGLVWSRINVVVAFDATPRYRMVGSVFVLLSLLPAHRVDLPVKLGIQVAAAVALSLAFVAVNHSDIAVIAQRRTTISTRVENVVVEMQHVAPAIPDSQRMPVELDRISAAKYRDALERYGSPVDFQANSDAFVIANGALSVRMAPGHAPAASCTTGTITLPIGESVTVHASHDTTITARRLGGAFEPVRKLKAGRSAIITTRGPSVSAVPWSIAAPDACG